MSAQKSKPSGLLGAFAGLVGVSAVAGILVTAMVAPALAVTSMTVNTSIGVFDSIPDYIELTALPQRNTLYAMKGGVATPFAQVFNQNREEVSWSNVSPFVKDAVVAAEDRRFYEHGGVDLASLARATQGFLSSGGEAASGGGSFGEARSAKVAREHDPRITVIRVTPNEGYYWTTKHGKAVAGVKMLVGAAIGKTLNDSIEGRLMFT